MRWALALTFALAAALALAGCDQQSMVQQNRYGAYAPSSLWNNGSEAQPVPENTVARQALQPVSIRDAPPLTAALMQTGRERFDIFCAPCHGRSGDGRGMIVQRGFPEPPQLYSDKLRSASAQQLFDVITNGYGVMYPFASRIDPTERWAIVAYIRALQVSQRINVADVPDAKERLP